MNEISEFIFAFLFIFTRTYSAIALIDWVDDKKPNIHRLLTTNIFIKRNRVLQDYFILEKVFNMFRIAPVKPISS